LPARRRAESLLLVLVGVILGFLFDDVIHKTLGSVLPSGTWGDSCACLGLLGSRELAGGCSMIVLLSLKDYLSLLVPFVA
jgi:hypothetical protein